MLKLIKVTAQHALNFQLTNLTCIVTGGSSAMTGVTSGLWGESGKKISVERFAVLIV
jgi:hypothetical protein